LKIWTIHEICAYTLLFTSLFSFIIGLKHKKKHRELSHLFIYSIASFLQVLYYEIVYRFNFSGPKTESTGFSFSIFLFLIIELSCLYFFFYQIKSCTKLAKKTLKYVFVFCIILYNFLLIKFSFFISHVEYIYFIQSLIILAPCLLYLYQLFVDPPTLNLSNEPSFWFFSGILIYFTLTLPLFFMIHYFESDTMRLMIDIINLLGYSLIFLFLIRAYLCKPKTAI
jgi:hypothetical protein